MYKRKVGLTELRTMGQEASLKQTLKKKICAQVSTKNFLLIKILG